MEEPEPRHKNPIDHVLDLFVYAPVGFVAEAPSLLPRFVRRGRDSVALLRAVSTYAITRDADGLREVMEQHPETRSTLRALGLVPAEPAPPGRNGSGTGAPTKTTDPVGNVVSLQEVKNTHPPVDVPEAATVAGNGAASPTAEPPAAEPPAAEPGIDPSTLAIPDYESLSASQVIPRLESLTRDELEAIRQYENGNRGRRTILNKIAQLQAS